MSTIVKNIHILKDGVWRPISKVFHQGEWKKMKGIFYDGVWYEIGSTCVVMPEGCAIATNEHPRWYKSEYYGTNNLGFNALPGGYSVGIGSSSNKGFHGHWWSSSYHSSYGTWSATMYSYNNAIQFDNVSTTYRLYIRAVKPSNNGTLTGDITNNDYIDGSGNYYNSVTIGNQKWIVENLYTTKYQDGTSIPSSYAYQLESYYGTVYSGSIINTGLVDYNGYRVPTKEDWEQLIEYLTTTNWCNGVSVTNSNVAQFLKSCRQVNHPLADMRFHIDIQEGIHQVKVYRNDNLWVTFNTTQKVSLPAELGDIYRLEITVLSGGISIFNHTERTLSYYGNSVDKSFDMHTLPYNITLKNTAL